MYSVSIILPCQRFVASSSVAYGSMMIVWKEAMGISYRLEVLGTIACLQHDNDM
jgi:hypothetical protein